MTQQQPGELLDALRRAVDEISDAEAALQETRHRRSQAIRACEAAGIPREEIAAAAGVQWPVSRQRWSVLRRS